MATTKAFSLSTQIFFQYKNIEEMLLYWIIYNIYCRQYYIFLR